MPLFRDASHLYELLGGFFASQTDTAEAEYIGKQNFVVQFIYHEPDALITIGPAGSLSLGSGRPSPGSGGRFEAGQGASGRFLEIAFGEVSVQPELTFEMKAEVAHRFWLGKVNLPTALARQQIKARGPLSKALKLLPTLQKLFPRYEQFLKERGAAELIPA